MTDLPVPPKKAAVPLSEAIAMGAAGRTQENGRGRWLWREALAFSWVDPDKNQYTLTVHIPSVTALGAALLAVYPLERLIWAEWSALEEQLRRTFPVLAERCQPPIAPNNEGRYWLEVLRELNDAHGWSLEEIATWLREQGL